MRFQTIFTALAASLFPGLKNPQAYAFGGEDMAEGLPWHHEDITVFALSGDDPYYPNDAHFSKAEKRG